MTTAQLADTLPTEWIDRFIEVFEAGRLQKYPQARFVNRRGECCLVAALVNAASARDVVESAAWSAFAGSPLEELSRRFESVRLTGQQFYEECLLVQASRSAVPAAV